MNAKARAARATALDQNNKEIADIHNQVKKLKAMLHTLRVNADADLAKWQEKFTENPVHALEWSASTFVTAARREICIRYQTTIEVAERENKYPSEILEMVNDQAMRQMCHLAYQGIHNSSSPGHNQMDGARIEVLAKFIGVMNDFS